MSELGLLFDFWEAVVSLDDYTMSGFVRSLVL